MTEEPKQMGPPGILDRVNYVLEMWEDPCEAPWTIYARTLWPALLAAILALFWSNLYQVARGYFRPRDPLQRGRSRRHGRGGRRASRPTPIQRLRRVASADPGTALGKRLPLAQDMRGREVTAGVHTMWRIDTAIQRLLWYWLLAEVAAQFAYNWTSLIYATEFCANSNDTVLLAVGTGGATSPIQGWIAATFANIVKLRGSATWNVASGSSSAAQFTVVCGAEYENISTGIASLRLRIRAHNPAQIMGQAHVFIPSGGRASLAVAATMRGPRSFTTEINVSGASVSGRGGQVYLQERD